MLEWWKHFNTILFSKFINMSKTVKVRKSLVKFFNIKPMVFLIQLKISGSEEIFCIWLIIQVTLSSSWSPWERHLFNTEFEFMQSQRILCMRRYLKIPFKFNLINRTRFRVICYHFILKFTLKYLFWNLLMKCCHLSSSRQGQKHNYLCFIPHVWNFVRFRCSKAQQISVTVMMQ